MNLLAISPQPNILYAATTAVYPDTYGFIGLFKSTDSGASWSPINNGLEVILDIRAPVNALILDPDHTGVLYLATSGYGVFKSSDGGAAWAPFNDGLTHLDVRALTLTSSPSTVVYAGTPGGVFQIVEEEH